MDLTSQSKKKVKVAVVDCDCSLPDVECGAGDVCRDACESNGGISGSVEPRTMWAGIIREKAPEAEIYRVPIYDKECGQALVKAIEQCIDLEMDLVTVGFGTKEVMSKNELLDVCRKAVRGGTMLIAAGEVDQEMYPAVFAAVIGVADGRVDASDGYAYRKHQVIECVVDAQRSFWFNGNRAMRANFAASYMTGFVAQFLQNHPNASLQKIRYFLAINSVEELRRRERLFVAPLSAKKGVARLWWGSDSFKWVKKRLTLTVHDTKSGG